MRKILLLAAFAALMTACPKKPPVDDGPKTTKAGGILESKSGSKVGGNVTFDALPDGRVKITLVVSGAAPGDHGVHVHETGDCSAADAASAGAHFNPHGLEHGALGAPSHHAGDFGNINVKADGTGQMTASSNSVSIDGKKDGVIGRALIVHEKADDLTTPPGGNAGARVACTVIKAM